MPFQIYFAFLMNVLGVQFTYYIYSAHLVGLGQEDGSLCGFFCFGLTVVGHLCNCLTVICTPIRPLLVLLK